MVDLSNQIGIIILKNPAICECSRAREQIFFLSNNPVLLPFFQIITYKTFENKFILGLYTFLSARDL